MTSDQVTTFFLGLNKIESTYPKIGRFHELNKYILIIEEPETGYAMLKPLNGIEKHGELWRKIEVLFDEIKLV